MPLRRPSLTVTQILGWADAYHAHTGKWPHSNSGPVPEAPGETWASINAALARGARGLPAGLSLARLLRQERGQRKGRPPLRAEQILAWAEAHRRRTGRWPTAASGPVADAPGESWAGIDVALSRGLRGLPGDTTLSWLLAGSKRGE